MGHPLVWWGTTLAIPTLAIFLLFHEWTLRRARPVLSLGFFLFLLFIFYFLFYFLFFYHFFSCILNIFKNKKDEHNHFQLFGSLIFGGYLLHYLPFFLMNRVTYLHHYLPALVFFSFF